VWIVSAWDHADTGDNYSTRTAYISDTQYNALWALFEPLNSTGGNSRPVMPLNDRVVECVDLSESSFSYETDLYVEEDNDYWWILWVCLTLLVWVLILLGVFFVLKKIGGKGAASEGNGQGYEQAEQGSGKV